MIKCPYCGDYDEKEIIDSLTMCAFCDKMFGEETDRIKEENNE